MAINNPNEEFATPSTDHVFICYARADEDFVLKLARNLKDRGVPVWLDQWNISPGVDWNKAIDDALYTCDQFLIVLSPAAVDSREVHSELRAALDENKSIVPVLYQDCQIPRHLRLIQYVDYRSRGPDDETAMAEVLYALSLPEPLGPNEAELEDLHRRAEDSIAAGQWAEARQLLTKIERMNPDYGQVSQLLAQVREILASLYKEAVASRNAGQYKEALEKLRELRAIDPSYPDPQRVQITAMRGRTRVPPKKNRARARAYTAIGVFGLVIVVAAVALVVFVAVLGGGTLTPSVGASHTPLPRPTTAEPNAKNNASIIDIRMQDGLYIVDFETYGFEPLLSGQHVHFFFNTVPPDQAGAGGRGPWHRYPTEPGQPNKSPFRLSVDQAPADATGMCIRVANPDHSVILDTGNCVELP